MPRIIISIEGVVIRDVPLSKERTTLGRRPYNDVVIDNLAVSGEHAVLHLSGGEARIEDLGSTNGSYVNGRAVQTQTLQENDIIEIAKYRIKYVAGPGPGAAWDEDGAGAPGVPTLPVPLDGGEPATPHGGPAATLKVLTGASAGREVALLKPVTRIGLPGVAVAAIVREERAFVVRAVQGDATSRVNGAPLGAAGHELKNGDLLELGGTRMSFSQAA